MSCLSLSELSDEQIDEMAADLRKRIALFRVTLTTETPAINPAFSPDGVTPGAVMAGASHMESHA